MVGNSWPPCCGDPLPPGDCGCSSYTTDTKWKVQFTTLFPCVKPVNGLYILSSEQGMLGCLGQCCFSIGSRFAIGTIPGSYFDYITFTFLPGPARGAGLEFIKWSVPGTVAEIAVYSVFSATLDCAGPIGPLIRQSDSTACAFVNPLTLMAEFV